MITTTIQKGPFTVAIVHDGEKITAVGFSKWSTIDQSQAKRDPITGQKLHYKNGSPVLAHPFRRKLGKEIAVGKAMKDLEKGVTDFTVDIDVEVQIEPGPVAEQVIEALEQVAEQLPGEVTIEKTEGRLELAVEEEQHDVPAAQIEFTIEETGDIKAPETPTITAAPTAGTVVPMKKRPGRPAGSKNKAVKTEAAAK